MYEKANSAVTAEVHAPRWLHRFIIGRKGQNVQKITQDLPRVCVHLGAKYTGLAIIIIWATHHIFAGLPVIILLSYGATHYITLLEICHVHM